MPQATWAIMCPVSLADMNEGAMGGIGHGTAQDFVSYRRSVALPEKQEPKKISDRISFRPPKINVGNTTGLFFEKNQHSGDGVRDGGTSRAQYRKRADPFATDAQTI